MPCAPPRCCIQAKIWVSGSRVQVRQILDWLIGLVEGLGCRVYSLELRVLGLRFRVWCSEFSAEG